MADINEWPTTFEEVLRDHLPLLAPDQRVDPGDSLADLGLDSLSTVGLLLALEDRFAVVFVDSLLTAKTFATPSSLWGALSKILSEQSTA